MDTDLELDAAEVGLDGDLAIHVAYDHDQVHVAFDQVHVAVGQQHHQTGHFVQLRNSL